MPLRTLLILIAVAMVVLALRRLLSRPRVNRSQSRPDTGNMVQCEYCGTYIPEAEAIRHQGRLYCSHHHLEEDNS